jgi:hypothetical protein
MNVKRVGTITALVLFLSLGIFLSQASTVFAQPPVTGFSVDPDPIYPNSLNVESSPRLNEFVSSLSYQVSDQIVGVYVPDSFAFPVIQQPENDPAFVSSAANVVTQFRLASDFGTTGFLAHNTLSGARFSDLHPGQKIFLIMGDGSIQTYMITAAHRYQALTPTSPYSRFRDLDQQFLEYSSTELFTKIYANPGQLVFQTCIEANGDANWGRLFVTAVPMAHQGVSISPIL